AQRAEDQTQESQRHHHDAVAVHRRQTAGLQAPVDQQRCDEGQQNLHHHLQAGQRDTQKGIALVLFELFQYLSHNVDASLIDGSGMGRLDRLLSIFCCSRKSCASSSSEKPWYTARLELSRVRASTGSRASALAVEESSFRRPSS